MLKKHVYKSGNRVRVWFYLPADVDADTAYLVGDFNGWDVSANPMKKRKDGTFYTALTLDAGRDYQFRYHLDGNRWENDWEADAYAPGEMGVENSVVKL